MAKSGWTDAPAEPGVDPPETFWPIARNMVETCEKQFLLGDYTKAVLAIRWCLAFEMPLPDWLGDEAIKAMLFAYQKGGAEGRGRKGGHRKRLESTMKHRERHRNVACEFSKLGNLDKACHRASVLLRETASSGEPREMKKSYRKVQKELTTVFGTTDP
jgi:hypothetical protein